jgi:hypothetical protein
MLPELNNCRREFALWWRQVVQRKVQSTKWTQVEAVALHVWVRSAADEVCCYASGMQSRQNPVQDVALCNTSKQFCSCAKADAPKLRFGTCYSWSNCNLISSLNLVSVYKSVGRASCLVTSFSKSFFRVLARTSAVMVEFFRCFAQSLRLLPSTYFPFHYSPYSVIRCYILWATDSVVKFSSHLLLCQLNSTMASCKASTK